MNMVKIDSRELYEKMDPRKLKKIQIYPSKQHCGYNKMSNQLPKLTKTIMSPLTTMPPKKLMIAPHNGVTVKPNPVPQPIQAVKVEDKAPVVNSSTTMQISAMKNSFEAKNVQSAIVPIPGVVAQSKPEPSKPNAAAVNYRSEKISLDAVHPFITCFMCKGYLIEATTIVECLHTFCHSCLMRHLARDKCCPQCDMSINKSKTNIKYDATIQSMVYKLVPGLYQKELLRRRAFYRQRPEEAKLATPEERGDDTEHLILSPLDLISLSLDYAEKETLEDMENDESIGDLLKPKFLNCPAIFKVEHLKKFIVSKFLINSSRFNVEISYKVKTIVLPEHYTLMDVAYIYTWKKEAPMPFFFRIIAKNSKCDELPEVALRRSPTTTLPNAAEEFPAKKKSVSFKEEIESISPKSETESRVVKSNDNGKRSPEYPKNPPRIETIKLKLDVSNNNVSIIKNTDSPAPKSDKKHKQKKDKKNKSEHSLPKYTIDRERSQPKKEEKKDEYEFDDDIDQQKLGFLNAFQLTAKKILEREKTDTKAKSDCIASTNNKHNLSQKQTESNINKRKSKEPVKSAPKKYKFHEMKSLNDGNKFLFTKTGDGHEITFDMSPKPLGSKPSLSKVKSDIMLAQQRADAKANKEQMSRVDKTPSVNNEQSSNDKLNNNTSKNVPLKPKKLPMLLPKQPSPATSPSVVQNSPSAVSPTAYVIKKPEAKQNYSSGEISVTKINEQNPQMRIYGPKSPVSKSKEPISSPQFKAPDVFAQPLPPKPKSNSSLPPPSQILKPYGYPIKMPKNIPENMQTPYGCRTPFYVPNSPSYSPNFDLKPQYKYANPSVYANFMQSMFSPADKPSSPVGPSGSSPKSSENSLKRPSSESSSSPVPPKRKSPSPTKNAAEGDSKSICILNKINFPSSLSVTLTNEQEENKKEQLRNKKQSIVNNNIEIIKLSEEKESKAGAANQPPVVKPANTSPTDKKVASTSDKKPSETKKISMPPLVPTTNSLMATSMANATQMLPPPVAKALTESGPCFQRAFLESLMTVTGKQNAEKNAQARKKDMPELLQEIKTEDGVAPEQPRPLPMLTPKSFARMPDASPNSSRKNISKTPPPSKSSDKASIDKKSLTPPPLSPQEAMLFNQSNAAQAVQLSMMLNALNAATKSPFSYTDYARMQQNMLLETMRKNVESQSAYLAMQMQQQLNQKNPSKPSSSASSQSSKH